MGYAIVWVSSWFALFLYFYGAWEYMCEPVIKAKPVTRLWLVPSLLAIAPLWVVVLMVYHVFFDWNAYLND